MSPAYETINPWAWQDQFGFSQAVATPSPSIAVPATGPVAERGTHRRARFRPRGPALLYRNLVK